MPEKQKSNNYKYTNKKCGLSIHKTNNVVLKEEAIRISNVN